MMKERGGTLLIWRQWELQRQLVENPQYHCGKVSFFLSLYQFFFLSFFFSIASLFRHFGLFIYIFLFFFFLFYPLIISNTILHLFLFCHFCKLFSAPLHIFHILLVACIFFSFFDFFITSQLSPLISTSLYLQVYGENYPQSW